MKYGLNTVLWVYPFSSKRLDLLKKIKDIGYDTAEIGIDDWSDSNIIPIRESLEENKLNSVLVGIPGPEKSIFNESGDIQKEGVKFIKGLIDQCSRTGATILVGPLYSVGTHPELIDPSVKEKAWKICVKNLKEIGKYARDNNIKIAVEPLNRYETNFINTAEETIRLINEVGIDNLGVLLDVYHMNIEEKNLEQAIIKTGKLLYHLHVPEHDRGTPGSGHTDWKGVARGLKKISFEGAAVIESCDPKIGSPIAELGAIWRTYDWGQEEIATRGFKFLKSIFK